MSDTTNRQKELSNSDKSIQPPPDGGLKAWLQVLGSWCLIFNTMGTNLVPNRGILHGDTHLVTFYFRDHSQLRRLPSLLRTRFHL